MKLSKLLPIVAGVGAVFIILGIDRKRIGVNAQPRNTRKENLLIGDSLFASGGAQSALEELTGERWSRLATVGWTTAQARAEVERADLTRYGTVVVLLGVNNFVNAAFPSERTIGDLAEIYRMAREAGCRVVAVQPTPWASYRRADEPSLQRHADVASWLSRGADGLVDAITDTSALGDGRDRLLAQYDAGDQLHLNRAGQRRLGELIHRST